jgi:DNA polymerase III sliding clamp (beta) subunit (PCNA family)
MTDLLSLAEREDDLVPEILPVDARLSFSAQSHTLISLLTSASDVAPVKEVIPYTSYVLIEAFDDRNEVEVSATDGERAITVIAPAIVRMSGSALVPAKRMLDILKLTEDTVRIDVLGTTATVRAGRAVWTVSTPPVDAHLLNFAMSEKDDWLWANVRRDELLHALELALPAVARTSARQSLMQAEVSKSQITSCDGVRAHKITLSTMAKDFKSTFPLRFIETAIKELRASAEEWVQLKSSHSTVLLTIGTSRIYTQRLNFDFPAVNHLVLGPALQNEEKLTVKLSELVSAIKRVRVNADPEYSAIFLSLRQSRGKWGLIVQARDKRGNASQEAIPADYEGPASSKDIALNHRYLLEFLACVDGEYVELRLGESTKSKTAPVYYESETFTGSLQPMAPNFVR